MIAELDSALAMQARELAQTTVSPAIFAHSLRAYQLGALAGAAMGLSYDAELVFVSAALHDLGFAFAPEQQRSFEIIGADMARALVDAHDRPRAQRVWDAIAMHTVPHLARAGAPESLLVHLGSASDAFGLRLPLSQDDVAAIEAHYPRGTIAEELTALTDAHTVAHPYGQLAAFRALGLRPR